jgi:hypothetical protein
MTGPPPGHECPGYKGSAGQAGFKNPCLKPHLWGAAFVARRFIAGWGGETTS